MGWGGLDLALIFPHDVKSQIWFDRVLMLL
jgi:hypothetical protein